MDVSITGFTGIGRELKRKPWGEGLVRERHSKEKDPEKKNGPIKEKRPCKKNSRIKEKRPYKKGIGP